MAASRIMLAPRDIKESLYASAFRDSAFGLLSLSWLLVSRTSSGFSNPPTLSACGPQSARAESSHPSSSFPASPSPAFPAPFPSGLPARENRSNVVIESKGSPFPLNPPPPRGGSRGEVRYASPVCGFCRGALCRCAGGGICSFYRGALCKCEGGAQLLRQDAWRLLHRGPL